MKKFCRISLFFLISVVLNSCVLMDTTSLDKKDLSKVVLQQSDIPEEFSNMAIFTDKDIEMFFPHETEDKVDAYYGVSYLYPHDGLNYIYSVIAVYDDETSASSVYNKVIQQVNPKLYMLKD